jgi:hypothetical protein
MIKKIKLHFEIYPRHNHVTIQLALNSLIYVIETWNYIIKVINIELCNTLNTYAEFCFDW